MHSVWFWNLCSEQLPLSVHFHPHQMKEFASCCGLRSSFWPSNKHSMIHEWQSITWQCWAAAGELGGIMFWGVVNKAVWKCWQLQVDKPRFKPDATLCFDCRPAVLFVHIHHIWFCLCLHFRVKCKVEETNPLSLKTVTKSCPHQQTAGPSGPDQTWY